jgi:hypothetical protein
MAKSRSNNKSYKKNYKKSQKGGNASDWTEQVVGKYPHQAGVGNVIQQNVPTINMTGGFSNSDIMSPGNLDDAPIPGAPPAYNISITTPGSAPMKGGRKKKPYSRNRKGGNVLSEIAVPAVLLIANQTFGKKTGKKYPMRRSRSRRFSRRRR